MQYILTEAELASLRDQIKEKEKLPSQELLERVVKFIACTMVPTESRKINKWETIEPRSEPYGCIHESLNNPWHCDLCPVQDICTMPKSWSK